MHPTKLTIEIIKLTKTMANVRARGEIARKFIVENAENHPSDMIAYVAQKLALSRQAVHKHVQRLVEESVISEAGQTRNKVYQLVPSISWPKNIALTEKSAKAWHRATMSRRLWGKCPTSL